MKIIVAHPAQQHSYRLATALKKQGYLFKYITTVYYKKGTLTRFTSRLLKGSFKKKAEMRCCNGFEDSDVIQFCECEGLIKLLCLYFKPLKKHYMFFKYNTADRFARKVAKYAIRNKADVVVTYDDSSPLLFEILKQKAPNITRVLDVSAANRQYMRCIYDEDTHYAPKFANRLKRECSIVWDDEKIERNSRELKNTDFFLVPSDFVAESLEFSGIKKEQILYCPYGVDISLFGCKEYSNNNEPLRFVYVGGIKELKGIYYLLEAFKQIDKRDAKLVIVGNCDKNDDVEPYLDYVEFTGYVPHSKVPSILKESDVFVFPSLGEGMSLSVLEAAACGLPLIVSQNSGIAEKMSDNQEGFIIKIQSVDDIIDKVKWFINNRDAIPQMGQRARKMAERYTWENYNEMIALRFKQIGE